MTYACVKHAFPHDFRSGPSYMDWDPTKWIILGLYQLKLVSNLRRAREDDLVEAVQRMHRKLSDGEAEQELDSWYGETWRIKQLEEYVEVKKGACVVVIDGFATDVTSYLGEHVSYTLIDSLDVPSSDSVAWRSEHNAKIFLSTSG